MEIEKKWILCFHLLPWIRQFTQSKHKLCYLFSAVQGKERYTWLVAGSAAGVDVDEKRKSWLFEQRESSFADGELS